MKKYFLPLTALILMYGFMPVLAQKSMSPADYVNPLIGAAGQGSCMAGPCLPHSSIYPSPNTLNPNNGGYKGGEKIVGFAQLHTQGTGGLSSYGNFLITPQTGLEILDENHASDKGDEIAKSYYYKVTLLKNNIVCEVVPAANAALYRFTYPEANDAMVTIDVARKLRGAIGLDDGYVNIIKEKNAISGGGTYKSNWPSNNTRWKMYFYAVFSKAPDNFGTWLNDQITDGNSSEKSVNSRMGAFFKFRTEANEPVYVKIAVSFRSEAHAQALLNQEIPGWEFDILKNEAKKAWNDKLGKVKIDASEKEKTIFYSNLFHSFVQPRNRTGNNAWNTEEIFWDDHYTMWDSWKTVFPLMCILDPEMVSGNINSFIARHKHNKYVAEAFINGLESPVGQGGNTVDKIIADAYVKKIPGVDWNEAYKILKYHADSARTPNYILNGYHYIGENHFYSNRMYSGSGTLAFSYNDFCAATLAKGLGKTEDYEKYSARSNNWKNIWNAEAESDGFKGFIMGKKSDGSFDNIDPKTGYNKHFYEGTCWIYSYVIPHDISGMIELMGGPETFTKRLVHALDNNYIDFGNEPSFMTPWWFCHPLINRPDLCSKYLRTQLMPKFTDTSLPGDDDQGAMGSLYFFARCGFFPVAGQDYYFLHGSSYKSITIMLPGKKKLKILAPDASEENRYLKSVKLNGELLTEYKISHADLMKGGKLEFEMTDRLHK